MDRSRRKFFQDSALGLFALSMGASCTTSIPSQSYPGKHKGYAWVALGSGPESNILRRINLSTYEYEEVLLPLGNAHAISKISTHPDELFVYEFHGSAVRVNVKTGEILARVDQTAELEFVGHGTYDPVRNIIWSSEKVGDLGLVRARSADTMKLIPGKEFSFPGGHHVIRLPESSLISSAGSDPAGKHFISFFDLSSLKIEKIVPTDYHGIHLYPLSSTEVISVSNQYTMDAERLRMTRRFTNPSTRKSMTPKDLEYAGTSPLLFADVSGQTKTFWDPSRTEIFHLGVGLDKVGTGNRFVTSHLLSHTVVVWKDFSPEKVISVPYPLVVVATLDGTEIVVQSEGFLRIYSVETGSLVKEIKYKQPVITLTKY